MCFNFFNNDMGINYIIHYPDTDEKGTSTDDLCEEASVKSTATSLVLPPINNNFIFSDSMSVVVENLGLHSLSFNPPRTRGSPDQRASMSNCLLF